MKIEYDFYEAFFPGNFIENVDIGACCDVMKDLKEYLEVELEWDLKSEEERVIARLDLGRFISFTLDFKFCPNCGEKIEFIERRRITKD